jgi:uncharacterized protein
MTREDGNVVVMRGRALVLGTAEGVALVSHRPIGFLGGVDADTGIVVERGHPLEGQALRGRVLVFPHGKGSTVGSYTIYRLAQAGLGPCAIINQESEPIVAVGALIAGIPMVDQIEIACIVTGMCVTVEDGEVRIE